MNREFWLGIVISGFLSLVLGIVGALLTPAIANWYKGWGKTRGAARVQRAKDDYTEILYYVEFPEKFTQSLIRNAITLLEAIGLWLMSSFMMLLLVMARIMAQVRNSPLSHSDVYIMRGMLVLGTLIAGLAYATASLTFMKISRLWYLVNEFDLYFLTVPDEVRDRQVEEQLLRMHKVMGSRLGGKTSL
jgi:hypothetical protein